MVFNKLYPDSYDDEQPELIPAQEEWEEIEAKEEEFTYDHNDGETTAVTLLLPSPIDFQGQQYYIVVTVDDPLQGFLYPATETISKKAVLHVDTRRLIAIYNWRAELEEMLPDVETVRRNVLLSFWRARAIDRASVEEPAVRHNLFRSAFPYKLKEE